ncbi:oligosaccharidyl-lipid flippase [[Emmonsia] crescens]|uniref:Man(5)GlcNAc(2)-PP-dolichol translocation protein RFT1 n=1 Tax=[Emmonsia] crescens TaxID=73230 RepID=A0A2B7Z994_9EURO|nr:oligosaccharidyl-lipid flippase [Emmonsia crescens]
MAPNGPGKSLVNESGALGTTYLILIQVVSRSLTFLANQVLLRYLSPGILGVATQLELYAVTTLYFSRESIRVALQRQPTSPQRSSSASTTERTDSEKPEESESCSYQEDTQAVVNLSYLAVALGGPLIYLLGIFYTRFAHQDVLRVPFFESSLKVSGLACFLELLTEPCFAVVQHRMLYKTRAMVETTAAVMKALTTCGISIWAARSGRDIGVLPFAVGQIAYAFTLLSAYFLTVGSYSKRGGFSVFPLPILYREKTKYYLNLFSTPLVFLSINIYAQSVVKHILTQGDSMALAAFSTLEEQGLYALASNYGSLVARIIFQPIEESSRNMLGKLLATSKTEPTAPESLKLAKSYLCCILHAYGIFSIMICALGPTIVPELLKLLIGSQWSFPGIHGLLSNYCYYIPLLAFNGITEAFVASTATHPELRQQAGWMGACSAGFITAAYLFLRIGKLGASGIIWANLMNLTLRIVWSCWFIKKYFRDRKDDLRITEALPNYGSVAIGVLAYAVMWGLQPGPESGLWDIFKILIVGGMFAVSM